jgi:hypothetical protein
MWCVSGKLKLALMIMFEEYLSLSWNQTIYSRVVVGSQQFSSRSFLSEIRSHRGVAHLKLSLKALALNRDIAERAAEEVLRTIPASMPTIPGNRQYDVLIFTFVREDPLEAIWEVQKLLILDDTGL